VGGGERATTHLSSSGLPLLLINTQKKERERERERRARVQAGVERRHPPDYPPSPPPPSLPSSPRRAGIFRVLISFLSPLCLLLIRVPPRGKTFLSHRRGVQLRAASLPASLLVAWLKCD